MQHRGTVLEYWSVIMVLDSEDIFRYKSNLDYRTKYINWWETEIWPWMASVRYFSNLFRSGKLLFEWNLIKCKQIKQKGYCLAPRAGGEAWSPLVFSPSENPRVLGSSVEEWLTAEGTKACPQFEGSTQSLPRFSDLQILFKTKGKKPPQSFSSFFFFIEKEG